MSFNDDQFSIKVGEWFEAKAQGRFAITLVVIIIAIATAAFIVGRGAGWW